MKLQERATRAAETVFTQCLALPPEAEVVILADETTVDTAGILAEAAVKLGFQCVPVYLTTQMQMALGGKRLTPALEAMLNGSTAVLICLNGTPECLPFRDHVRRTAWNPGCKVAHMPGVNQSTLLLADVDYKTLSAQCEMLALALAKGRQMELISRDRQGNKYCLQVTLQPWLRLPIISDGVIQAGSWGNVPSGETYIAPPEGLAEGTIVINGSIPGRRLKPNEEIILRFQKGTLVEWGPVESPAVQHLLWTQIEFAQSQGDQHWSNLAEIGFGLNPHVRQLTGKPLLDEKKYGTVHIALGDNTDMGGKVESRIHCDMVCSSPEVSIDGKRILRNGCFVLKADEWREDYHVIRLPETWSRHLSLKCAATNADTDDQGRLKRLWDTSSGRVCSVPVGNEETSRMVAGVYQLIQRNGQLVSIEELAGQKPRTDLRQLLKLTYLLKLYGLVNQQGDDG